MPKIIRSSRKDTRQARNKKKLVKHGRYLGKTKPHQKQLLSGKGKISKYQKKLDLETEEDLEIAQLKKKLKLSDKSLPASFYDEGLSYILDYKTDLNKQDVCSDSNNESISENALSSLSEVESEESVETQQLREEGKPIKRTSVERERDEIGDSERIIVPIPASNQTVDIALTRRITGLVNRLSKSNLSYTTGQVLQLYRDSSAHDMNEGISCALSRACCQEVLVQERLSIECMLLLAITQGKTVTAGQLGAFFISKCVKQFDTCYENEKEPSKLCHNIVRCLSYLYSFKVLTSVLIYDIVRKLVCELSTMDIELLLIILKTVGLDIRKEDPKSMKDIIMEIQGKRRLIEEQIDDSRVVWMLDTINAIKTNNHRKIPNYDPSKLEEYCKLLKAASVMDVTPFNLRYEDVLILEASGMARLLGTGGKELSLETKNGSFSKETAKFTKLMQQQRMNTDIRRKIFTVLMTSSDYMEAVQNLLKLDLTKIQGREIPKIIVECCIQENPFNLYYAYLSQHVCNSARDNQVTFQYTIWDKIKNLGEMSNFQTTNFIKLIIHLVQSKSLSISILKVISFNEIDKITIKFLKRILSLIIFELSVDTIVHIFQGLKGKDHLQNFRYSLSLFLKHLMKSEDPVKSRRVSIVQNSMGMSYPIKI